MSGRRGFENGGVPPRWLKCPRKSKGLVNNNFLVFKTPLSSRYDEYVPPVDRFPPSMLIQSMKVYKRPFKLWIDLTNTNRYYDKDEVESQGIAYVKLNCQGAEGPPDPDQVQIFNRIVSKFLEKNEDGIVGVHCTHGFNRSGFMICSYLVEHDDWSISAAINAFITEREPGIYKQEYLNKLYELYGEDEPPPAAPVKPEWSLQDQHVHDDDGHTNGVPRFSNGGTPFNNNLEVNKRPSGSQGGGGGAPKRRRTEGAYKIKDFMEGVPGVDQVVEPTLVQRIQKKVQDMCEWRDGGFPGSQPVSMNRENINFLSSRPYMLSWKADGTRYMMLIDGRDQVYFVDRDNCVFQAHGLTFPYRKNPAEHLYETLCDGEMVIDKFEGKDFPRYLIYDIIKFRGEDVGKVEFRTRLTCIDKEIVFERQRAMRAGEIDRESEPFGVRKKEFWYLNDAENVLTGKLTQQLSHEPDGAVFQPIPDPYISGRCDSVLKWKPPTMNSIDFKLVINKQEGEGLLTKRIGHLYVGSLREPFSQLKKLTRDVMGLDGKIIECKWDDGWVFMRERTDKSFPNAFTTAKAVLNSIQNPVTLEYLLHFIREYQFRKRGGIV